MISVTLLENNNKKIKMWQANPDENASLASDTSFVVIGQGSLPTEHADQTYNSYCYNYGLPSDMVKTSTSWGSDGGDSKDIQNKLDQLLKENYQLKETLHQNNLAMKTQFDTLFMWQEEVLQTHQTHKEKFLETKELVIKLRAENALLKKQITTGDSQPGTSPKEDILQKKVDSLQQSLIALEMRNMGKSFEHFGAERLSDEKTELENRCRYLEQELIKTKADLEETHKLNDFLREKNNELRLKIEENNGQKMSFSMGSMLPNAEARAQISNLLKQLEEERSKVARLKQMLLPSLPGNADDVSSTSSHFTEYKEQLDNLNQSIDKQSERFGTMKSWLCLAEESVPYKDDEVEAQMRGQITLLRSLLSQEQNNSEQKKKCLQDMQAQFQKLFKDYEDLQKAWDKFNSQKEGREQNIAEVEKIVGQLKQKEELLIAKEKQCQEMKAEMDQLLLGCEEVAILRAQVELYQSDFNAEREAREKAVAKQTEFEEHIRLLKRQNQDLEARLQRLSENSGSQAEGSSTRIAPPVQNVAETRQTETPAPTPSQQQPAQPNPEPEAIMATEEVEVVNPFSCFKCEKSFREFRQLQEHVEECLELNN